MNACTKDSRTGPRLGFVVPERFVRRNLARETYRSRRQQLRENLRALAKETNPNLPWYSPQGAAQALAAHGPVIAALRAETAVPTDTDAYLRNLRWLQLNRRLAHHIRERAYRARLIAQGHRFIDHDELLAALRTQFRGAHA